MFSPRHLLEGQLSVERICGLSVDKVRGRTETLSPGALTLSRKKHHPGTLAEAGILGYFPVECGRSGRSLMPLVGVQGS